MHSDVSKPPSSVSAKTCGTVSTMNLQFLAGGHDLDICGPLTDAVKISETVKCKTYIAYGTCSE